MDIVELLATNAGPIVAGLIGSVATLMGVLITRTTMRRSSRTQRTDDYRREVRSAASSVVGAARAFIDAASTYGRSVFWIEGSVRTTSDHNERYLTYQKTSVELEEKIADFEFLVDIDMLAAASLVINFHVELAHLARPEPKLSNYTQAEFRQDLTEFQKQVNDLKKTSLPGFRKSVIKHVPHTIVEERRRRKRILNLFITSWRWLIEQHRKNIPLLRLRKNH